MTCSTYDRLASGAALLALIDRRREKSHSPSLGSSIERIIIERELRELEEEAVLAAQRDLPGRLQKTDLP
jgi:hypothetical protein